MASAVEGLLPQQPTASSRSPPTHFHPNSTYPLQIVLHEARYTTVRFGCRSLFAFVTSRKVSIILDMDGFGINFSVTRASMDSVVILLKSKETTLNWSTYNACWMRRQRSIWRLRPRFQLTLDVCCRKWAGSLPSPFSAQFCMSVVMEPPYRFTRSRLFFFIKCAFMVLRDVRLTIDAYHEAERNLITTRTFQRS